MGSLWVVPQSKDMQVGVGMNGCWTCPSPKVTLDGHQPPSDPDEYKSSWKMDEWMIGGDI